MRTFTPLALLMVGPLLAAPAPKAAKGGKAAAAIDGTWEVAERHLNGDRDDSASPIRWTISGQSLVIEMRGRAVFRRVEGPTYRLVRPAGGRANEIDYVHTPADPGVPPSVFRGVFGLDGDTLKVCISHSPELGRPAACGPSAGSDLYVLKRAKGGRKEE